MTPNFDLKSKKKSIPPCELQCDISSLAYSTFANLLDENVRNSNGSPNSSKKKKHYQIPMLHLLTYAKAREDEADYIDHIVEFFEAIDNEFMAQWYFKQKTRLLKGITIVMIGT